MYKKKFNLTTVFKVVVKDVYFIIILMLIVIFLMALSPYVSVKITESLGDTIALIINGSNEFKTAAYILLLQFLFYIFDLMLNSLNKITSLKLSQRVKLLLKTLLVEKIHKLPFVNFEAPEFQNRISRASLASDNKVISIVLSIFKILESVLSIVFLSKVILTFNSMLFIVLVIAIFPSLFLSIKNARDRYKFQFRQSEIIREESYAQSILLSKETLREVKIFQHGSFLLNKWRMLYLKINGEALRDEMKNEVAQVSSNSLNNLAGGISLGLLIWICQNSNLTLGMYLAFSQSILMIQNKFYTSITNVGGIWNNMLFIHDYIFFMNLEEEVSGTSPFTLKDKIVVNDLTFKYPNQSEEVLRGISLEIKAGSRVAIVGGNGAGKSSFVKCLIGINRANTGSIYVDDVSLDEFDLDELRGNISAVFQDFVKYQFTVRENIGVGDITKINDLSSIHIAAHNGGVLQDISRFSEEFETRLGSLTKNSRELSGGQWQKIAISRALLKKTQLFIFDEPTAALDPLSESEIIEKFLELTMGHTSLIITHRLASCTKVDHIFVLKDGELIEQGNHLELMKSNGEYAKMFLSQSQYFTEHSNKPA